jgi:hypothetical protein
LYRLLRMILLTTYVPVLVVALGLIYSENQPRHVRDMERSLIVCDDGKSYSFSSVGRGYVLTPLTSSDAEVAHSLCAYGQTTAPSEGLITVHIAGENNSPVSSTGVPRSEIPMTPSEFAAKVKAKYPEYRDLTDEELTKRILQRYPVYRKAAGNLKSSDLWARYQRWLASDGSGPWVKYRAASAVVEFKELHSYTLKVAFTSEGSWARTVSYDQERSQVRGLEEQRLVASRGCRP